MSEEKKCYHRYKKAIAIDTYEHANELQRMLLATWWCPTCGALTVDSGRVWWEPSNETNSNS